MFVTGDKAMSYQQSMVGRRIAIVSLSAHNWPIVKDRLAAIAEAVDSAPAGSIVKVDCGTFHRSRSCMRAGLGGRPSQSSGGAGMISELITEADCK